MFETTYDQMRCSSFGKKQHLLVECKIILHTFSKIIETFSELSTVHDVVSEFSHAENEKYNLLKKYNFKCVSDAPNEK